MKRLGLILLATGWMLPVIPRSVSARNAIAQTAELEAAGNQTAEGSGRTHALIVVGLAGDEEHARDFEATLETWKKWLEVVARVAPDDITILRGWSGGEAERLANREVIRQVANQLSEELRAEDAFWLFLAGHGSSDRRHTWFHLPGPDLHAGEWAGLFNELAAGEQVFWLTQSASGGFLKPMSRRGRVVMTATDSAQEANETRFPHLLAELMQQDLDAAAEESATTSDRSLLELFRQVSDRTGKSYEAEQLVPTEHAQLDDNGDGVGTEADQLSDFGAEPASAESSRIVDGALADRIRFPSFVSAGQQTSADHSNPSTEEATDE